MVWIVADRVQLETCCCCRFDMFNVKLHRVKFESVKARWYQLFTLSDDLIGKKRHPYR